MPNSVLLRAFRRLATALLFSFAATPAVANEEDFINAREAFRAGDARKLDFHASRLSNYVLEPYVRYWQLRLRLDESGAAEVRRFISTYSDTPLASRLLADWLRHLGRTQQWDQFELDHALYTGTDVDISCYAIQSKIRSGNAAALNEAKPLWFTTRDAPENCAPLFAALAQNGQLTEDDIWARVRTSLEVGQVSPAHRASQLLGPGQQPDYRTLTLITNNPAGHLERGQFDMATRAGRETTLYATYRLARSAPQQAAAHWARIENRFSREERAYVWGQIAYFGALRHDADVLTWFARAGKLSDVQLAWKARAAMRAGHWHTVGSAIDAMSAKERSDSAWRYWKARSLQSNGREADALAILKPLSREYNFYGQLALEDLGQRIATPAAAYRPTAAELQSMSENASVRRALELYRLNLRVDGVREWIWAIRSFDDRQLLAAAEIARRNELYDRAINTADKTEQTHDFALRYLAPFRDVLRVRSAQMGLDEAWVYGLIRQESRFIADARSSVGARGLMQLMPATAKWVASKMGLRNIADVTEVDTNVSLGTYYLRHVLETLDNHPVLASAAYNAGPGRARAWRPDSPVEGAIYAETIPFNETRDYVKKVMSNASYYGHAFTQQLQSLKARLGSVSPRRTREASLGDTP